MLKSVLKVTSQYKETAKLIEDNEIDLKQFCKKYGLDELAEANKETSKPSKDLSVALECFRLFYLYSFGDKKCVFKSLVGKNVAVFEKELKDYTLKTVSASNGSSRVLDSFFDYDAALHMLIYKGYVKAILVKDEDTNEQGLVLVYGLPEPMSIAEIDNIIENYPDVATIPEDIMVNIVLTFEFLSMNEKALSALSLLRPSYLATTRVLLEKIRPLAGELYSYVRLD